MACLICIPSPMIPPGPLTERKSPANFRRSAASLRGGIVSLFECLVNRCQAQQSSLSWLPRFTLAPSISDTLVMIERYSGHEPPSRIAGSSRAGNSARERRSGTTSWPSFLLKPQACPPRVITSEMRAEKTILMSPRNFFLAHAWVPWVRLPAAGLKALWRAF